MNHALVRLKADREQQPDLKPREQIDAEPAAIVEDRVHQFLISRPPMMRKPRRIRRGGVSGTVVVAG